MRWKMLKAQVRSFFKNVKKGKYYSIFRGVWDSKYRADIHHMLVLTCSQDLVLGHGSVPLHSIVHGHAINYPEWVEHLAYHINIYGWKKLEPIKVIWDSSKNKWLVVDGNHRLAALKKTLPGYMSIPVFILRPVMENDPGEIEVRDVSYSQVLIGVPVKRGHK